MFAHRLVLDCTRGIVIPLRSLYLAHAIGKAQSAPVDLGSRDMPTYRGHSVGLTFNSVLNYLMIILFVCASYRHLTSPVRAWQDGFNEGYSRIKVAFAAPTRDTNALCARLLLLKQREPMARCGNGGAASSAHARGINAGIEAAIAEIPEDSGLSLVTDSDVRAFERSGGSNSSLSGLY